MKMHATINLVDGAPTEFRIWHSGNNPTDKGDSVFSKRSAEALSKEQARRGNLYSIDVDHMSLNPIAPPESRKAVGWHRLEVRDDEKGDPELWAVDVEWTDVVKAGLEKKPPEWRYFSPAYDVDKKTREVIAYLNTALTNNPATWSVTALASRVGSTRSTRMKFKDVMAALAGDDEEKKAAAMAAIKAAFGEDDGDAEKKDDDGDSKKDTEEPP
ncbi:MAG: hypothetical protein JWM74_382, partial [Myxococcaceae bacterium]|nr:hypothetical protein [Myxococcaceae bacterium]